MRAIRSGGGASLRRVVAALVGMLLTCGATATMAPSASAKEIDEERRALLRVLRMDPYRPDREVFDRIGDGVRDRLIGIATDPDQPGRVRRRAVSSLRVYPDERTRRFLDSLLWEPSLRESEVGRSMRVAAVRALSDAYGAAVARELLELREAEDPRVREAAARGLGDSGATWVIRHLEAWLPHTEHLRVRWAVDRAIQALREENDG